MERVVIEQDPPDDEQTRRVFRALLVASETLASGLWRHRANDGLRNLVTGGAMTLADLRSITVGFVASTTLLAIERDEVRDADGWATLVACVERNSTRTGDPRAEVLGAFEGALSSGAERGLLASCSVEGSCTEAVLSALEPVIVALQRATQGTNDAMDFVASLAALYGAQVDLDVGEGVVVRASTIGPTAAFDPATEMLLREVADPLFEKASRGADGAWPAGGTRVFDPSCGDGTLLVAIVRRMREWLASHNPRLDERDLERVLVAVVDQSVRGAARSRRIVALARMAIWLELGRRPDAAILIRCVSWVAPGQSPRSLVTDDRPMLVLLDASTSVERALDDAVAVSSDQTLIAAIVKSEVASLSAYRSLRKRVTATCVVRQPLIEARAQRGARRAALSLLCAVRSDAALEGSEVRWARNVEGLEPVAALLFESLSLEATLGEVLQSYSRELAKRENRTIIRIEQPDARWGFARVSEVDRSQCESPGHFGISDRSWNADSLRAYLASSLVRWFAWMLADNRCVAPREISPLELVLPRAPSYERTTALSNLGRAMLAADVQGGRETLDELVFGMFFVTQPHEALVRSWATNPGVLPRSNTALAVPPLDRGPVEGATEAASPSSPRYELREDRSIAPRVEGAHDKGRGSRSTVPTNSRSNGTGRGSESLLKGRSDDGRAAPVVGPKRDTTQPEGDAEREAWAILRAAGRDGLSRGALVRRAREHEQDEIREAIANLATEGWIVVDGDGDEAVIRSVRDTIFRTSR